MDRRRLAEPPPGRSRRLGRVGVILGCKISRLLTHRTERTDFRSIYQGSAVVCAPPGRATPPWRAPTTRWAPAQSLLLCGRGVHSRGTRRQVLAGASAAATATAAPTTATCLCHCSLTPSLSPSSCGHASLPAGSQVLRSGAWLRPQRAAAVGLAQRAVPAAAGRGQRQRALQAQQAVRNEGGGGSSREQLQEEVHRLRAALQQAREQATALQRHNRELEDIATTAVAAVVAAKQREQAPRGQGQQAAAAAAAAAVVWGARGSRTCLCPSNSPPRPPMTRRSRLGGRGLTSSLVCCSH